jgi:MGT family glycosyltransferase
MARYLFTCWPFTGHVLPQLSIASALRERGHDVAFHTGSSARRLVEPLGFDVLPFDRVDEARATHDVQRLELAAGRGRAPAGELVRTFRSWLVETIPAQVADLRALHASWAPDVLVADVGMWAPHLILREADDMPVAISTIFMGPLIPGRDAPPPGLGLRPPRTATGRALARAVVRGTEIAGTGLRRRVDALRAQYGLPPMGCSVNTFSSRVPLYLVPSVRSLDYDRRDLPAAVQYVGPCLYHAPHDARTAAWLERLPVGRPWIHVTEGTLRSGEPFLLEAAAVGLAGGPWEVIASGRDVPARSGVHAARWIDHGVLLPRCAAVVTTGGAGTIMASLYHGVPLVVVPTTWDKPDNARRVAEAGVGVVVSPRRCTAASVRSAVERVLADRRFHARAVAVARELVSAPGAAGAAVRLEALAPAGVAL